MLGSSHKHVTHSLEYKSRSHFLFLLLLPHPFSQFSACSERESGPRYERLGKQHHTSWLSGDWRMRRGGRGLEVNYRQQRGHRAYYFGAGTCNGPMGMTFTTRARPHPSITIHTHKPPSHAITHIYTEGADSGTQWSDNEKALSVWHRQDDELNPWLISGCVRGPPSSP